MQLIANQLATCGGWLASLCTLLSRLTGLAEIFVLSIVFVISWMTLRTAPAFLSSTLGSLFSLSIPMQYQFALMQQNSRRRASGRQVDREQARHLRGYWRLLLCASMAEWTVLDMFQDGADKSFTVCAKTAAMALVFMSKVRGQWVSDRLQGVAHETRLHPTLANNADRARIY
jgi:hypothetical protein